MWNILLNQIVVRLSKKSRDLETTQVKVQLYFVILYQFQANDIN